MRPILWKMIDYECFARMCKRFSICGHLRVYSTGTDGNGLGIAFMANMEEMFRMIDNIEKEENW